jgi:hypothetical protein
MNTSRSPYVDRHNHLHYPTPIQLLAELVLRGDHHNTLARYILDTNDQPVATPLTRQIEARHNRYILDTNDQPDASRPAM